MIKVAINGFGRIGRMVLKAGLNDKNIQFVAINDLTPIENLAYLLEHDTVHGWLGKKVTARGNNLVISGKSIPVYSEKDPSKLPWAKLKVDVVAECTGFFTDPAKAKAHLDAGAKKVLISAPCKCEEKNPYPYKTVVVGVNDKEYKGVKIVSNGSCTTNCLAPMAKVINDTFKIKSAYLTTTHAYTATQNLIDGPNKNLRRSRAAALNIVPTSTGAAKAIHEVIPELKGKMDGLALRVPVVDGSVTDFISLVEKKTSVEQVNAAFKKAAQKMKGILEYSEDDLVSTDILTNPHSVIFDSKLTKVIGGNLIQVFGWYDNEWGFSCRMIDLIKLMAKK